MENIDSLSEEDATALRLERRRAYCSKGGKMKTESQQRARRALAILMNAAKNPQMRRLATLNGHFKNKQTPPGSVAHYRKRAGLTQGELADKIGACKPAVTNWERAKAEIGCLFLTRLQVLWDLTPEEADCLRKLSRPPQKRHSTVKGEQ